ncbi:ATPase [Aureococcus anophagefferens]|nr:ATPase [Aureococcus anophagefferens]
MEAFLTPTKKSMSAKSDSARSVTLAEPLLDPSRKHSYGAEGETLVTPLGRRSFHRGASFSKHDSDDEEANRALLEWSELSIRFGDKVAVDRASGAVGKGEFLALMGPSGAGKTTLLDLLTGRLGAGTREGDVLVEGHAFSEEIVWAMSSYVPQEDVFMPHMTALESLTFVARLRLPRRESDADVAERCRTLLGEVGMGHVEHVYVGGVLAGGLSIRASAAASGGACRSPRACRAAIWAMFDQVYFLSAGKVLYSGPTGGAVPWFKSLGFLSGGSGTEGNPADVILDLIAVDFEKPAEIFGATTIRDAGDVATAAAAFDEDQRTKGTKVKAALLTFIVCLLAAGVWGRQHRAPSVKGLASPDGLDKYADYVWYRGASLAFLVFPALIAYVPIGCLMYDRQFFIRESAQRYYSVAAYYAAYMSVELTLVFVVNMPIAMLYAHLANLNADTSWPGIVVYGLVASGVAILYSQILVFSVAVSPSVDVAFVVASFFFISGFIGSGFPVSPNGMNPTFKWVSWLSTFRYPYDLLERVQHGADFAEEMVGYRREGGVLGDTLMMLAYCSVFHVPSYLALRFCYR